MLPPNVPTPPPTRRPQAIETSVVPNPEARIALNGISSERTELGPTIKKSWVPFDNFCDRGAALLGWLTECCTEHIKQLLGLTIDHGLRGTRWSELNGSVRHGRSVLSHLGR